MKLLFKVFDHFWEEYDKIINNTHIKKPISKALYNTWKWCDNIEEPRSRKVNNIICLKMDNEYSKIVNKIIAEKHKGKWILHHDNFGHVYWTCSECGFIGDCNHTITNFCSNCGTDMRKN